MDRYKFGRKLIGISEKDQGFYSGHLKIDLVNDKKIKKRSVFLVKPTFLPCVCEVYNNKNKIAVDVLGNRRNVKSDDIKTVESPIFSNNQYL